MTAPPAQRPDGIFGVVARAATGIILTTFLFWFSCDCRDTTIARLRSPDGHHYAFVLCRKCRSRSAYTTELRISRLPWYLAGGGNVFVADDNAGQAPSGSECGPNLKVQWLTATRLQIRYNENDHLYTQVSRIDDVTVAYQVESPEWLQHE